jgi:Spy/CpxP family protein refolding chaperone
MKTSTRIVSTAFAAVSLAAASLAFAHPGQGMGMGPGMGMGMGYCMGADQGMGHGQGMGYGQGMGPGGGQRMGMGPGMYGPQTATSLGARMGELKNELKITAAQEPAWDKYQALVLQQAESAQATRSAMQAQMRDPKTAGTVDHVAQHEAMAKARLEQQAARTAARNELMAVLTPEQKALAAQRMGAGYGRHMSMRGPRW